MLLDLLRQRYLDSLRSCPARWKVLIVDDYTKKMLNSVLTTYDILEEGVQQVDSITHNRTSQPRLAAIYLLTPTSHNVQLVINDFQPQSNTPTQPTSNSGSRLSSKKKDQLAVQGHQQQQKQQGPKYASAYLHFVDGIDDRLVERLTSVLPDGYLLALKELYTNFHAIEARAFTLKMPRSFFTLYAPPDKSPQDSFQRWEDEIGWMSRALVNALATLGEYPLIRYYNPPSSFHGILGPGVTAGEHVGKRLAERVQREIDAYARDNNDFPPMTDPPRPRGVLLITDRSMDLCAPLLHEFTYQAMCNDLLEIENGTTYRYTFQNASGASEDREAILSDDDKVWTEVRHMHMKEALDKLIADFKAYAGEHGGKFGGGEGGTSLNDMKDMLASLPQLREVKEKLSLHLTMAEKCMSLFERKKLPLSASVEQCCATGVTPEGKTPKTLVEEMVPLLDDRSVSSTDKLRIIALYIMHRDGVPEGDKKRLYQHARLALHEMDAIDNLSYLGVNVSKDSGKKRRPLFKQKPEDDAYDISRYQPALKYMIEEHIADRLDQAVFPYVRDAPVSTQSTSRLGSIRSVASSAPSPQQSTGSLRSARPQWTSTRGKKAVDEPKQRVLVFVAGGMTYSEIRACYKLSESHNKDIFIGSTNVVTPVEFVSDLSNLDRGAGTSLSSHNSQAATSYQAPKKASKTPVAPSQVSQSSMDNRYASAAPQNQGQGQGQGQYAQQPPPSQQQRHPSSSSTASRPPNSGSYPAQAPHPSGYPQPNAVYMNRPSPPPVQDPRYAAGGMGGGGGGMPPGSRPQQQMYAGQGQSQNQNQVPSRSSVQQQQQPQSLTSSSSGGMVSQNAEVKKKKKKLFGF